MIFILNDPTESREMSAYSKYVHTTDVRYQWKETGKAESEHLRMRFSMTGAPEKDVLFYRLTRTNKHMTIDDQLT